MSKENYHINVNKTLVEVTKKQYLTYYQAKRRMRYYEHDIKIETPIRDKNGNIKGYTPSKEDSFERICGMGVDFSDSLESVEDLVIRKIMLDKLHKALDKLPEGERKLIYALFLSNDGKGMSEREYAKSIGLSKTAVHARKEKILYNLRKFL